jgi:two-component system CheB/CheR fusion protein
VTSAGSKPDESASEPPEVTAADDFVERALLPFPVVGIGASAGGIEALNGFFDGLPQVSGIAFVVVQHLPPERESLMAEILTRHTHMPVLQVTGGLALQAGHVYVTRPGFTVTLERGVFQLGEPVEKRGHRRPVDDFFRSLADTQHEKAIAVVLSGMGTNGTAGARAIKAAGGLCFAQLPESAEFPAMPTSVIHAGYADQVLAPREIGPAIVQYVKYSSLDAQGSAAARAQEILQRERGHLTDILAILRTHTGHDFSGYKKATVLRRLQRRMGLASLFTLADYAARLRDSAEEVRALANDMMINVTGFFRDLQSWEALRELVVRPLVTGWQSNMPIRAWVSACSSGEEAYSLAMLLAEEISSSGKSIEVKIFATDAAVKSLELARAGVYPGGIEGDLSLERLDRFFERDEHVYRIRKQIRDMVVFAPQNVLRDPPFSHVDICTCRNLLIYLEPDVQERVLALLHFALKHGGTLFLGSAETPGSLKSLFETVSPQYRIYRRIAPHSHRHPELPALAARTIAAAPRLAAYGPRPATTFAVQQALFEQFGPPTVVVDAEDRIAYFHGDTTPFLIQPLGEPTRDLFEVLHPSMRSALREALRQARAGDGRIVIDAVEMQNGGGAPRVRITVAALVAAGGPGYIRVSFEPEGSRAPSAEPDSAVETGPAEGVTKHAANDALLQDKLRIARRELQSTIEAFESSNEELKASNEEVISINEELQSTNEELETSKEELQSMNEELITVNGQLQAKIAELEAANNDLSNLWSSTSIGVVFLDIQLQVRRFTPAMNELIALRPSDIGRPIDHFQPKFSDGDLTEEARQVLATLIPSEAETRTHSGAWYLRRTVPYRTADNRIDGIVITFVDITARKRAEQAVDAAQARLQATIDQMPAAMLMVNVPSGTVSYGNRRAAKLFGLPFPLPMLGAPWSSASIAFKGLHANGQVYEPHEWPLARTLASGAAVSDEELDFLRADGTRGSLSVSSAPIQGRSGEMVAAVATFWDISERKRLEATLREGEQRSRLLLESTADYAIFMIDAEGRIATWNSGAERLLGWSEVEAIGSPAAMLYTPEDRMLGVPERQLRLALDNEKASDERAYMRKDASRFWASGTLTAIHDSTGTVPGFACVMRDHTELTQAREYLHEALRTSEELRLSAESANHAKDDFISTVSHELRTPLNTIRLWAGLFLGGKVTARNIDAGFQAIDRAAKAQQALIDDLLDASRMASGKLRLALRETRLAEVVQGAIDAVLPSATARSIKLEARLSDEVGVVRADPDRIQQVVLNLLSNAVKFTPSGGAIEIELSRDAGAVQIIVRDNGIGIRPDFLPLVFDRFKQAEAVTSRQHAGLGLGLAIARELVELHGGAISAHSEGEGRGSTFSVRLPLARRQELPVANGDTDASTEAKLAGMQVLIVEDESAAAEAMWQFLEAAGARVRIATSAASAREALALQRPNVMVCDIGLPGEDGYQLLNSIRKREGEWHTPRVGAVAVTAFAGDEDRRRALEAGFDEHVPKPVDPGQLIDVLARVVGAPQ